MIFDEYHKTKNTIFQIYMKVGRGLPPNTLKGKILKYYTLQHHLS